MGVAQNILHREQQHYATSLEISILNTCNDLLHGIIMVTKINEIIFYSTVKHTFIQQLLHE